VPHRQGRRPKENIEGVCPRRIQDFLEPCLLLLVHCEEIHGYELPDSLESFGFAANPVDLSTVYRLLRNSEDEELVASRWHHGTAGPARRLYRLTPEGDRYRACWVADLRETDRGLHSFLDRYGSHMRGHR